MWGEGDPADILAGRAARAPVLAGLKVRALDRLDAATLDRSPLIVAQPRAMAPEELVALDGWVRNGGRALIFADPQLDWPSRYALGDPRRAPPVTLLDPLLTHWGITLDLAADGVGRWRAPSCTAVSAITIDCAIGKGRARLIADADLLNRQGSARTALEAELDALQNDPPSDDADQWRMRFGAALIVALLVGLALYSWRWRGT